MAKFLILSIIFFTSTLLHAEEYLCLEKEVSTTESLAKQAQEILKKTDPEIESFCAGLIPKADYEMQGKSVDEILENHTIRSEYLTKSPLPQNKKTYCSSTPQEMIQRFCLLKGKLGHDNDGGLFGLQTGVCWWNSRFHRKVNYLTYYNSQTPSHYTDEEVENIITRIGKYEVTGINGYNSFYDFINDKNYPKRKDILQKYLQKQMGKSTLRLEWIKGFKGKGNSESIDQKNRQLKEIGKIKNQLRDKNKVSFVVVQQPGFPAHSFLVYDMIEINDGVGNKAYKIKVQDSAYQFKTEFVENDFVFDTKSGQWFSDKNYKKLVLNRKQGKEPRILVDHSKWQSAELVRDLGKPYVVGAQEWTLWNHYNNDMDKIDEGFKKECGHSLF
jgi:hypothetical protein